MAGFEPLRGSPGFNRTDFVFNYNMRETPPDCVVWGEPVLANETLLFSQLS
jgi:hypothetical protein